MADWSDIPAVCFDKDLCQLLGLKLRTLQKLRKAHAFPIPELARLDKRHRHSRRDVVAYLERETAAAPLRRRAS